MKYRVLVNACNLEILDIYKDLGTVHDFRMFKESLACVLPEGIQVPADSGYRGIHEYLPKMPSFLLRRLKNTR